MIALIGLVVGAVIGLYLDPTVPVALAPYLPIAVNGHRLTSLSAIRSASQAVLVDLAPVLPPYRVEAIGDVRAMQTAFARSSAANHLTFLTGTYGITVSTSSQAELRLPGAPSATLRYAAPVSDVASSEPSEEKGSS